MPNFAIDDRLSFTLSKLTYIVYCFLSEQTCR